MKLVVDTDYKKTTLKFTLKTEATHIYKGFVFQKYIIYNTPTRTISDL